MSDRALHFVLPSHSDAVLSRMNALREEGLFWDVTLVLGGPPGAAEGPVCFHGHRVVLAAASHFLRDQFLLRGAEAELSVAVVTSVEVGRRLLLSCYTGMLEVPPCDLVMYLAAASALQMTAVVERCAQALSRYLSPLLEDASEGQGPRAEDIHETEEESGNEDGGNDGCSEKLLGLESGIMDDKDVGLSHDEIQCTGDEEKRKNDLNDTIKPAISIPLDTVKGSSYLCPQCDHVFQHMDGYVRHLKEQHRHKCLVCEKSFAHDSALCRHARLHTLKPYRCPLCHSSFPSRSSLQYHVHVHTSVATAPPKGR